MPSGGDVAPAPTLCSQCRTESVVVRLRLTQALCRDCAISVVSHRIIAGLAGTTPGGSRVLLALSGGTASTALLHTLFEALDCGRSRRHASWAACAFVDMAPLLPFFAHPHDVALLHEARRRVVRAAVARGFSIAVLSPESAFVDAGVAAAGAGSSSVADESSGAAAVGDGVAAAGEDRSAPPADATAPAASELSGVLPLPLVGAWAAGAQVDLPDATRAQKALPNVDEAALDAAVAALDAHLAAARAAPAAAAAAARLHSLFAAARSLDARARLQTAVLERCLAATAGAACVAAGHVLLGETMDRAAVRLLQATVEGGGYTAPLGAGALDTRYAAPVTAAEALTSTTEAVAVSTAAAAAGTASTASAAAHSPKLHLPFRWYAARSAETERARERREGEALPRPDTAHGGALLCRPLADVESREAALLVRYGGIADAAPCPPRMLTLAPPRSSIAAATAALLGGLQASFPNTVHNMTRTLRKAPLPPNAAAHALPSETAPITAAAFGAGEAFAAARSAPQCALCAQLLPAAGSAQATRNAEAAARLGLFGHSAGAAAAGAAAAATAAAAARAASAGAADEPAAAATAEPRLVAAPAAAPHSVRLQQSFCHTCLLALREFSAAHAHAGSGSAGGAAADGGAASAAGAAGAASRRPMLVASGTAGAGAGGPAPLVSLVAALSGSLPTATVATLMRSLLPSAPAADSEATAGSGAAAGALAAASDPAGAAAGATATPTAAPAASSRGRVVTRADMRAELRGFLLEEEGEGEGDE